MTKLFIEQPRLHRSVNYFPEYIQDRDRWSDLVLEQFVVNYVMTEYIPAITSRTCILVISGVLCSGLLLCHVVGNISDHQNDQL